MEDVGSQRDIFTQAVKQAKKTHHLVAVINHSGVEDFGHYTAYGYSHGLWKFYDDDRVTRVSQIDEVTGGQEALFCIYEQIEQKSAKQIIKSISAAVSGQTRVIGGGQAARPAEEPVSQKPVEQLKKSANSVFE